MEIKKASLLLWLASIVSAVNFDHRRQENTISTASLPVIFTVPQSAWQSLNNSVSGRLGKGKPVALPCFTSYQNGSATSPSPNSPDNSQCAVVKAGVNRSSYLVSQFGSYHNPQFPTCMSTGQRCSLNPVNPGNTPINDTCYQGQVPDYYVDAQSVSDIQQTLRFAQSHKIPITVKNTGHDYKGRSTGRHSLAVWTHNIQPPMSISQSFVADLCSQPVGPVLTYGAGAIFADIYDYTHQRGYMIVGGLCPTVGMAGGWVAGGGHGALTPVYGLGVDNVVQMKVVLPDGTFITANRCQNQDLFFALRGGGGGTFGVVTEVTSRIYEEVPITIALVQIRPQTVQQQREITTLYVQNSARFMDAAWSAYMGSGSGAGGSYTFLGSNIRLNVTGANENLAPLLQYANSLPNSTVSVFTLPHYYAFQTSSIARAFVEPSIGYAIAQSSRLIPKDNFNGATNQTILVDALMARDYGAFLVPPINVELPASDRPGGPGEASVTPAWRTSLWHLVYQNIWDPANPAANTPAAITNQFRSVSRNMDPIRRLTPGGGAYMNEGDTYEPDAPASFWGQTNYARLLALKRRLDPQNLLSCFRCVGWDQNSSDRFGCYPTI